MEEKSNPYEPPKIQEVGQRGSWLEPLFIGIDWVNWSLATLEMIVVSILVISIVAGTLLYNIVLLVSWLFGTPE